MKKVILKLLPKPDTSNYGDQIVWRKKGGYAGEKVLQKVKTQLLTMGFTQGGLTSGGTPDGSNISHRDVISHKKLGWTVSFFMNYGVTASSNIFSITVAKPSTVKEDTEPLDEAKISEKDFLKKIQKTQLTVADLLKFCKAIDPSTPVRGDVSSAVPARTARIAKHGDAVVITVGAGKVQSSGGLSSSSQSHGW